MKNKYNTINTSIRSSNGYEIHITIKQPNNIENSTNAIIMIHGFASDRHSSTILKTAEDFVKNENFIHISFDMLAHGESEAGSEYFIVENFLDDINTVYKYVVKNYPTVKISMFGSSFGGLLTLLFASKYNYNIHKYILRCPAVNMHSNFISTILSISEKTEDDFKKNGITFGYEKDFHIPYKFYESLLRNDIYKKYNNVYNKNFLIIHGTRDNIVPLSDILNFTEKNKKFIKLELIENANHNFKNPGDIEKIIDLTKHYILEN